MTRRPLVAGNWKMNLGLDDARALAAAVGLAAAESPSVDVAIFPPFPWIVPARDALAGAPVELGAQHCHSEASGAFTGEVSPVMLAEVCELILAGHSERRHIFGESDEQVGDKVAAILRAGAQAVLCVGETLDERRDGRARGVVARQLWTGLAGVDAGIERVTIAYEPVWAIGTGVPATPDDAQEMCAFVRERLRERFGAAGDDVRVLYGGSVTPSNAVALFSQADIDGGLVGGASLKAHDFRLIIAAAEGAGRL